MPVLAAIVAAPLLTGAVATGVAYWETERQGDPCRPPAIRMESANIAALPGPNSPACRKLREAQAEQSAEAAKAESKPAEKTK